MVFQLCFLGYLKDANRMIQGEHFKGRMLQIMKADSRMLPSIFKGWFKCKPFIGYLLNAVMSPAILKECANGNTNPR